MRIQRVWHSNVKMPNQTLEWLWYHSIPLKMNQPNMPLLFCFRKWTITSFPLSLVVTIVTWFNNVLANCWSKKANYGQLWVILGLFWANREFKKRIKWWIMLHGPKWWNGLLKKCSYFQYLLGCWSLLFETV